MIPWTIIPVHGLSAGKSRLAPVLSDARRRELNAFLVQHALGAVREAFAGLGQCVVTSACEETLAFAKGKGAIALSEPAAAGLNRALEGARAFARSRDAARLLVLSCDLPLLTAAALARASEPAGESAREGGDAGQPGVVLVPDRRQSGTNALALPAALEFRFAFGAGSIHAHAAEAARLGARVEIRHIAEIAFDVDEVEDFEEWRRDFPPG